VKFPLARAPMAAPTCDTFADARLARPGVPAWDRHWRHPGPGRAGRLSGRVRERAAGYLYPPRR